MWKDDSREDQPMTELERNELVGYGLIFNQLMQSDRFKTFFKLNYDLVKVVDDDTKTITMHVLELPDAKVAERMRAHMIEEKKNAPMVEVVSANTLKSL